MFSQFILAMSVQAAEQIPVGAIPSETGVVEQGDVGTYVSNIINWLLGLLGVVLLLIIIVAAFNYITAGDDSSKTSGALASIRNSVIGLFILMAAWILSNTILAATIGAGGAG